MVVALRLRSETGTLSGDEAARVALLQDARRGYGAIGALGHVARLAREAGV